MDIAAWGPQGCREPHYPGQTSVGHPGLTLSRARGQPVSLLTHRGWGAQETRALGAATHSWSLLSMLLELGLQ